MPLDPASARHQLALLAERKSARVLGWPRDWRPHEIFNPLTGEPFTDAQAWDFVAQLLREPSFAIEEVQLDSPPGKTAYVLQAPLNLRAYPIT